MASRLRRITEALYNSRCPLVLKAGRDYLENSLLDV